jgi:hypothetical protein
MIVAYTNSPGTVSGNTPGITWEASTVPGALLVRDGGDLVWVKKTNLLFRTPPSRIHSDAAIMSWIDKYEKDSLHAVVMFGGVPSETSIEVLGDTWIYEQTPTLTRWHQLQDPFDPSANDVAVPPRYGHSLASVGFDTPFVVMFGGANMTMTTGDAGGAGGAGGVDHAATLGDTWILASHWSVDTHSLRWINVSTHDGPSSRYRQAMASHRGDKSGLLRSVMFGGCADVPCTKLLSDTWVFSGQPSNDRKQLLDTKWTQISRVSSSPSGRRSHAMSFLGNVNGAVLMFGGTCGVGLGEAADLCSDGLGADQPPGTGLTWELNHYDLWVRIPPPPPKVPLARWPAPRTEITMAALVENEAPEETEGYTVVMLGGKSSGNELKETWTYGPQDSEGSSTWRLLAPSSTPIDRAMFSMCKIPDENIAVLFGGSVALTDQHTAVGLRDNKLGGDTWEYNAQLRSWKQIAADPGKPGKKFYFDRYY